MSRTPFKLYSNESEMAPASCRLCFDKTEAAALLSLNVGSIDWLVRTRKLSYRKIAGKVRFTLSDLEKYVESCLVENGSKVSERLCELP